MKLGDIKANTLDDNDGDYYEVYDWTGFVPFSDFIQPYSTDGKFVGKFTYASQEYLDSVGSAGEPGWYAFDDLRCVGDCTNSLKLAFAHGFFLNAGDGNAGLAPTVNFDGEVKTTESIIPVDNCIMFTGNATPVEIKLGDIKANTLDDNDGDYYEVYDWTGFVPFSDFIQPYTTDGKFVGKYTYASQEYLDSVGSAGEPGWYAFDDLRCVGECFNETITLPAGRAFFLNAGDGNAGLAPTITLPSALKSAGK